MAIEARENGGREAGARQGEELSASLIEAILYSY